MICQYEWCWWQLWVDSLFIVNFFGFCLFLFVKLPGAETLYKKVRNRQYLTLKFKLIFSAQVPAEATKIVLNLLIFISKYSKLLDFFVSVKIVYADVTFLFKELWSNRCNC